MVFPFGQHPLKECNSFSVNCNVDLAIFCSGCDLSSVLKPENNPTIVEHRHLFDHFHPNSGIKLCQFSGLGYDRPQIGLDFLREIKALILERLNIVKPAAKLDAEHEIDVFINNWKLLASQQKGLRYYVLKTDKYNRLMNTYGEACDDTEKATLRSMREVESSASMYYYTEE